MLIIIFAIVFCAWTGKTTVAKKLERDFECVRIEMQNVITSAVALADIGKCAYKLWDIKLK